MIRKLEVSDWKIYRRIRLLEHKKEERILDLMKQKKKGYVVLVMMKDL